MARQSEMRFTFEPIGGVAVDVIEFELEEEISRPSVLTLDLSSTNPAIDFGQILDQPALFVLIGSSPHVSHPWRRYRHHRMPSRPRLIKLSYADKTSVSAKISTPSFCC
jgi:uncharacterized protein involved in type VI secretion and phage assembly